MIHMPRYDAGPRTGEEPPPLPQTEPSALRARVPCEHSREAVKNHVPNLAFPRPLRPRTITLRFARGQLLEVLEPHTSKQRRLQPVSDFAPAHRLALRCLGGMKNLNLRLQPCRDETSPDSHLKVGLRQPCGSRYVPRQA
jgi:hypothetical protein